MAEITELLRQAVDEVEGLSREALQAQEALTRLGRLASLLGERVETGATESHALMDQAAARVAEAEAELARDATAAAAGLRALRAASTRLREQTGAFLAQVHGRLEELGQERDRALADADAGSEAAEAALERYTARVEALEAAADDRLAESRRHLAALDEQAEELRRQVDERGDAVLAQIRALADGTRSHGQALVDSYDAMLAALHEQLVAIQSVLKARADDAVVEMTRRLSRDALESLADAVKPLRKTLELLDDWGGKSRRRSEEHLGELMKRLEGITRVLENIRGPLETVRHQLH